MTSTRVVTETCRFEQARCPRQESNLCTRFRKPLLYPLSYGGELRFFAGNFAQRRFTILLLAASTISVAALASGNRDAAEASVLLGEARGELVRQHIVGRYLDSSGDPAEALVEKARELRADLVVVGRTLGSGASVSAQVGRSASCDVLIVT